MGLIKKPNELTVKNALSALIYGQPGMGKTTLALSSPQPLLLDFDGGVHRVNAAHRVDTVQISKWEEVDEVLTSGEIAEYKTIVIDTAGKMLSFMDKYIMKNNPKMKKADGTLSLQGYGVRKNMFINFVNQVTLMGKSVIFVAHEREEKNGEDKQIRPEIGGSVWKMAGTVFFSALLDFVSLAALLPVLYILLKGGENRRAALLFCLLAIGIIVVKSVLITVATRYQDKCLLSLYRRLSFSLFSAYYRRGLLFIRERGCNRLAYEVNVVCYSFSHSLLSSIYRMAGDALLIILVTVAMLVFDGMSVLLLYASFLPFMCAYLLVVKKRVRKYGEDDMLAKRKQSRTVMDTFGGYMELEVNNAFPISQTAFLKGLDRISSNRMKLDTILGLPLFLSELSVIIGLGLLVAFGEGDVKMVVGVFAIAAFRLLPALRTLLTGWTQIQNTAYCLNTIEEGLSRPVEAVSTYSEEMPFEKEITVKELAYAYPGSGAVLEKFNCRICKGEHVGFKGSSGVGKSTLFNLLAGLLEPNSGEIWIDGILLNGTTRSSWMKRLGYVPQEVFIFNGTLAENIALGRKKIDYDRVKEILEQVSLSRWAEALPDGIHTLLGEAGGRLSGGQRQRIGIARALYKRVEVLLLDEATSALDNVTEKEINETLCQLKEKYKGLTILSIAHRESSLTYCERIITIKNEHE